MEFSLKVHHWVKFGFNNNLGDLVSFKFSGRVNFQFLIHISSSWLILGSHTEYQLPMLYASNLTLFESSCPPPYSNRVNYQFLLHISFSWLILGSHTEFQLPRLYRSDLTLFWVGFHPPPAPIGLTTNFYFIFLLVGLYWLIDWLIYLIYFEAS